MARNIEVHFSKHPRGTKVFMDGKDISEFVERVEVIAAVNEVHRVVLHCISTGGPDYVVKGILLVEEEGTAGD